MYLIRDYKLANELQKGTLTEKQQMIYFLISSMFMLPFLSATVAAMASGDKRSVDIFSIASDVTLLAYIFILVIIPYRVNKAGDNKNFIARHICFSLPITIVSSIVFFVSAFVLVIGFTIFGYNLVDNGDVTYQEASSIMNIIFYTCGIVSYLYTIRRYVVCFKIASGQKEIA